MDPLTMLLIGGGLSLGSSFLASKDKSSKSKYKKIPTMTPEQEKLFKYLGNQLYGGGEEGGFGQAFQQLLNDLQGGEESYDKFAAPFKREFEEQTIPGIAERFAGLGAMGGGLSSSAFGQSLSSAGAGLQEKLAALKTGLQGQARNDIFSLLQNYMGTSGFGYQPQKGKVNPIYNALGMMGSGMFKGGLGRF